MKRVLTVMISSRIEYYLILGYHGVIPRARPMTHQAASSFTFYAVTAPVLAVKLQLN
jgi:hypothetical protein